MSIRKHELHQDIARYLIDMNSLRHVLLDLVTELFKSRQECNLDGIEYCRLDAILTKTLRRVKREKSKGEING